MQARHGGERARWSVLIGLLTAVCLASAPGCKTTKSNDDKPLVDDVALAELSTKQAEEVGAWVAAVYTGAGGEAPMILREAQGSAYVALRDHGKLLAEAWGSDGQLANSLSKAIADAKAGMPAGATADMVEIDLAHSFHTITELNKGEMLRWASGKRTGIRGLDLSYGDHSERVAPTKMLAAGDSFKDVYGRFFKQAGADVNYANFGSGGGKVRVFEAQQLIVRLPSGQGVKLLRGNVYVEPREVTQANTQATVELLIGWMLSNLHEDGRMTYMWLPTISAEKPNDNNMIRQWMATNALIKLAERRDDPALWARIAKNIDYNLEHFYKQEGEFGTIEFQGKVKLGAVALAAMAIVTHPDRARWQTQEHGLRRTVSELWSEDGSFDCFFKPRTSDDRNGNVQNFYPGETLLLWAYLYRESRDPELLRRFAASFHYYKTWHLDPSDPKRRRPSFIPWHTQADFIVWETLRTPQPAEPAEPAEPVQPTDSVAQAGEPADDDGAAKLTPEGWPVGTVPATPVELTPKELAEFVFETNDWLIDKMEVWEESAFDDEKGRFYSRKTDYGSAHASSTGVYIEGMIDAYQIAKTIGDKPREDRYRKALSRAIRSVMQIQFVDDVDMFYVTDREHTKGGLRTTVMRNEIRVDNVQHVLMGVLKVVDRFAAADYATD